MNRNIFSAWYCLAVFGLCLLTYWASAPFVGRFQAIWSFAFLAFLVLLPVFWLTFFRREESDERDVSFLRRALHNGISNGFFTVAVITASLWTAFMCGGIQTISIHFLWLPIFCGFLVALFTFSVVLLLFYYQGENADKENGL